MPDTTVIISTNATKAALTGQVAQAIIDLDTIIAQAVTGMTNAQRDASIRRLAQIEQVIIRRLVQITNE